jgi:ABC-type sulfate transport system permease subunit
MANNAAPLVLLFGFAKLGAIPAIILATVCCLPSLFIARTAIRLLERQGTDRVNPAIEAMSRLMGGSIVMLTYVAVGGILAVTWEYYPG